MTDYKLNTCPVPIVVGATGLSGLEQCLRLIVATFAYSVPMDRSFAGLGSFVDSPAPHKVAALIAELTEAIEKYEPRVVVTSISLEPNPEALMKGQVYPLITFHLKDGVEL